MVTCIKPNWKPFGLLKQQLFLKLSLQDIGSHISRFSKLRMSYLNLPIDPYLSHSNATPTRFRRYQNFDVYTGKCDLFKFFPKDSYQFSQEVEDSRQKVRTFFPMEHKVLDEDFYHLMTQIIALALHHQPNIHCLNVSVHQVRLLSYPETEADNAPEGIHQDGADYIISALVMNKHNVENDRSIIYNPQLQPIYETQLGEGEFIFQDDKQLWHDITPIKAKRNFLGYRDIIGFDLKIID